MVASGNHRFRSRTVRPDEGEGYWRDAGTSHEPGHEDGRGKFIVAAFHAGRTHAARHRGRADTAGDSRRGDPVVGFGEWTPIGPGEQAQYVESGHIVFHAPDVREGELQAVGFDLSRLAVRGDPVSVLDGVFRSENQEELTSQRRYRAQ